MTQKQLSITLLAFLMSATTALPLVAAAKQETPPAQSITVKTIGNVSCVVSSIEKNADGTLKKCTLSENKTVPGADLTCAANSSMTLNAEGTLEQCTLAFDRSYPDPTGVICDDGKTINLYPDGSLAKCTAVTEKKSALLGGTCAINSTVELYPDGQLRKCISNVEKKVPAAATADVHVTEFTCAAKSAIGFYTNGKVQQCTPTESVYMRGKGTCLPGEPATFQIDGKVQECTYTYPLYQNKSCKVESRVSFHPNGSFKDCTLPEDKSVGKAVCKADAAVSYRANGTIETCTLAAPVELAPGKSLPIGTVVTIDEKQVVAEKQATPAAPVAPPATPEKPVASATK